MRWKAYHLERKTKSTGLIWDAKFLGKEFKSQRNLPLNHHLDYLYLLFDGHTRLILSTICFPYFVCSKENYDVLGI